jgi:hypothetical protein
VKQFNTSGVNVSWLFIAEHSEFETTGPRERERVETTGSGRISTSGETGQGLIVAAQPGGLGTETGSPDAWS